MQRKPSKKEVTAALESQAPQATRQAPQTLARSTKRRTLAQAGVGFDDELPFYKADDWFQSSEDVESMSFDILMARSSTKGQFGPKVIFKLKDHESEEISLCSLPANEPRLKFVEAFATDSTPIGPCQFVRFDSGKAQAYFDIQMVETEVPF